MSQLTTQLSELREAVRLAKESYAKYESFVRAGGQSSQYEAVRSFVHYTEHLEASVVRLQSEVERRMRRFADMSVLQLELRNMRTGKTVKIACAKPNERCELPSISETAFVAVCKKLKIADGEMPHVYDRDALAVVGRNGQVVVEIQPVVVL